MTARGDTSSASAVSSTLSPPKNNIPQSNLVGLRLISAIKNQIVWMTSSVATRLAIMTKIFLLRFQPSERLLCSLLYFRNGIGLSQKFQSLLTVEIVTNNVCCLSSDKTIGM